jgi:ABC-2 type transport system permease protein
MSAALGVEWIKLRTIRSTAWALLAFVSVSVVFSALACWESETEGGGPGRPGDNDVILDSLAGIWFGQVALAVLAVLAITSEYAHRMIRTTFASDPRRHRVLAAKTTVVGAVALLAGLITSASCFLLGQWILRGNGFTYENGYPATTLRDGDAQRAVVASGLYLALLAVFSLGVGTILRHTAGAITLVLALLLGPVIAISFLPESVAEWFEQLSLMGAGLATQQTVHTADSIPLGPWEGLGVVAAYAAASLLLALWAIRARDA